MVRRRYQNGSLFVRGKKRKVYVLRYYEDVYLSNGSRGRERRAVVLGPVSEIGTKKAAKQRAADHLRKLNEGGGTVKATFSFKELARQWKESILPLKKESTRTFYTEVLDTHLLPAFADRKICDLTRAEIQAFITKKHGRYSWQTVQHIKLTLMQVLGQAVEWGYLESSPAEQIKTPKKPARAERLVLSPELARKLIGRVPGIYRLLLAVAALTGMRRCELFALQLGDVEPEKRRVHVRRRIYRGCIDTPKTPRSIRAIPIPEWLAQELGELKARLGADDGDFVFAGPTGMPLSATTVARRVLRPILKELGLPRQSWHCFRRSFATWLSESGVPIKTVQELLGHASATTTLEYYVESSWESRRQAVEDLGCQLDPNGLKSAPLVSEVLRLSA